MKRLHMMLYLNGSQVLCELAWTGGPQKHWAHSLVPQAPGWRSEKGEISDLQWGIKGERTSKDIYLLWQIDAICYLWLAVAKCIQASPQYEPALLVWLAVFSLPHSRFSLSTTGMTTGAVKADVLDLHAKIGRWLFSSCIAGFFCCLWHSWS